MQKTLTKNVPFKAGSVLLFKNRFKLSESATFISSGPVFQLSMWENPHPFKSKHKLLPSILEHKPHFLTVSHSDFRSGLVHISGMMARPPKFEWC